MSDTPLLGLPYLAAAQAQKHVTHNEALTLLDALVQAAVTSRTLATPPSTPADGARYLLPASPTGAWAGQAGKIALRMDGAWRFIAPREGFCLWVSDEDKLVTFDGTNWNDIGISSALQNLSLVGINATADTTNRLTVSAPATLFNHAGNGHQVKINKNAATDSASFLFQTGFSGRAEFGATGDDSFHLKVSADGASFAEVFVADNATARLDIHNTLRLVPMATAPQTATDGQLWFDAEQKALRLHADDNATTLPSLGALAARHLVFN